MHRGWVKLWRRIDTSEVSLLPHSHFRVWCWILTNVTHRPTTVAGVDLEPGEMLTTYGRIAMGTEWKENRTSQRLTLQQLRTATQHLVKLQMLELQQEPQQGCLRLKVLHWDEYQGSEDLTATGTTTELQQDFNRTSTTEQEGKKVRRLRITPKQENLLSDSSDAEVSHTPGTNGHGKRESIAVVATGLWDHWLTVYPEHGRMSFTRDRRRVVEARLREGIDPATIRAAVEHSRLDPWWNGEKDGEWKAELQTICGKGSSIEKLAFNSRSAIVDPHLQRVGRLRELKARLGNTAVKAMCETEELWREVCSA